MERMHLVSSDRFHFPWKSQDVTGVSHVFDYSSRRMAFSFFPEQDERFARIILQSADPSGVSEGVDSSLDDEISA